MKYGHTDEVSNITETDKIPCTRCGKNEWKREQSKRFALLICVHCKYRRNVRHV